MRISTWVGFAFVIFFAVGLRAQSTAYIYTGKVFTSVASGPFSTSESLNGFFATSAPLAPNLSAANITPLLTYFSFPIPGWR